MEFPAAFIDEQIRKSETIKHKYADLQKKEPYYANKPKDTKERVHNDEKENFRRMGWNNWTDVEILLERYKACILSKEAHTKLSSKWKEIPYLRDFPLEQAWRLCVDERYQKNDGPKFTIDDELSFIAGTKRLLNAVLDGVCINKLKFDGHSPIKLTAEYYQQLHDIAVEGTYRKVREGAEKQKFELGYADQRGTGFLFPSASGCVTGEGYEELQEKIACQKGGPKVDARYGVAGHPIGNSCDWVTLDSEYHTKAMMREERLEIADAIINKYYEEITSAKEQNDEDAKLTAIVRCCQDLDQAHLFVDGNIRTIAFGVMPKMLLENGFPPCILPDPNILDGSSVEEIKDAIRKGLKTFQSRCKQTP